MEFLLFILFLQAIFCRIIYESTLYEELQVTEEGYIQDGSFLFVDSKFHSAVFISGEKTIVMGENKNSKFGLSESDITDPIHLSSLDEIKIKSSCQTESSTHFLTHEGDVYSVGRNFNGVLGLDKIEEILVKNPTKVEHEESISRISCGNEHVLAISKNGNVYGWGSNSKKQIDNTENDYYSKPEMIEFQGISEKVILIKSGSYHSCLMSENITACWGSNNNNDFSVFCEEDKWLCILSDSFTPLIVDIFPVGFRTYVQTEDSFLVIGKNTQGNLGIGMESSVSQFTEIALPSGTSIKDVSSLENSTTFLLSNEGEIFFAGENGKPFMPESSNYTVFERFLPENNTFSHISYNGETLYSMEKVKCYEIEENNDEVCSGEGICVDEDNCVCNSGFFGVDCRSTYDIEKRRGFYVFGGFTNKDFLENSENTASIISNENYGKNLESIEMFAVGEEHILFQSSGLLYSVGRGQEGQLGDGYTFWRNNPVLVNDTLWKDFIDVDLSTGYIVDVCAGDGFSAILHSNGVIYSFGTGYFGELGQGGGNNNTKSFTPKGVEMKYLLRENSDFKFEKITCGKYHVIASFNGSVYSYGKNEKGQLGNSGNYDVFQPMKINEGKNGAEIKAKKLSAGYEHSCILDENNTLFVFGSNSKGQTSSQRNYPFILEEDVENVFCTGYTTFIVKNNQLYAIGDNTYGQLGINSYTEQFTSFMNVFGLGIYDSLDIDGNDIIDIQGGEKHTLVLLKSGEVYASGSNEDGAFGTEFEIKNYLTFEKISLYDNNDDEIMVRQISTSSASSFFLQSFQCNGKNYHEGICSSNGDCDYNSTCSCYYGYMGDDCETITCYSIPDYENETVCGGHGECVGPDHCICSSDRWVGGECDKDQVLQDFLIALSSLGIFGIILITLIVFLCLIMTMSLAIICVKEEKIEYDLEKLKKKFGDFGEDDEKWEKKDNNNIILKKKKKKSL